MSLIDLCCAHGAVTTGARLLGKRADVRNKSNTVQYKPRKKSNDREMYPLPFAFAFKRKTSRV